jgi:integrase
VTIPKGGRLRYVPLTIRLAAALREHRHCVADRVLCLADGSPLSADVVKHHVERAARRAQIRQNGVHRLRHTFCSHLAMRGAPARAIQELRATRICRRRSVHAPESGGARQRDQAAGWVERVEILETCGDGDRKSADLQPR